MLGSSMDSKEQKDSTKRPSPKSVAERVRKHRLRKQRQELQIALGIAKLATGNSAGDQSKTLASLLEKAAKTPDLQDDQLSLLDNAIDRLRQRPRY